MARQPLECELRKGAPPRQRLWEAIRARRKFTQPEIQADTLIHWDTVASYVQGLVNAGIVRVVEGNTDREGSRYVMWRYELTVDAGAQAPRLSKSGEPTRSALGTQAIWTAMRILRRFSLPSLLQSCPSPQPKEATVKSYVARLVGAGYLRPRIVSKGRYGRGQSVYELVRDTGPLAPAITREKRVVDRNVT